ncbi:hypothetical protein [Streptomyces pseudovenezuelae]|uniref:Transposase n=1 Tax=Streptomyces pseudovenezuelae TaxID=67350 RepID=A0ABT6LZ67_9ACTN|nr:hypothetical protein [Streptomyces pseudovenezuelae]MDH6221602.1 hypothetical protein [Streptomyces pseudovenezuelae]
MRPALTKVVGYLGANDRTGIVDGTEIRGQRRNPPPAGLAVQLVIAVSRYAYR